MHILIIPSERYMPEDDSLQGIFQHHQAQALKRAGYKVGVISPPEMHSVRLLWKDLSLDWPTGIQEDDEGVPVFKYYGWYWIPRIEPAQRWLWWRAWKILFKRYVNQQGMPDLIHAHNARFAGIFASKIEQQWRIPYVLTEHSSTYAREPIQSSELASIKEAFKRADKRLTVSPSLGHLLERTVGGSVCPWEWGPNILDNRFEKNTLVPRSKIRPNEPFCFLNVGLLIKIKGQAELLRAFASKFKGRSDVQLRIGADGPLKEELKILSNELGIDKQVIFLGDLNREQVLSEMQACDVYVHSSHYETFGVVLIEALSCGKPVIAMASGGPECIVLKKNGILVPLHDIARLAEAMVIMRENIDDYDDIEIRKDCLVRFGEEAIVNQLSRIYHEIRQNKNG